MLYRRVTTYCNLTGIVKRHSWTSDYSNLDHPIRALIAAWKMAYHAHGITRTIQPYLLLLLLVPMQEKFKLWDIALNSVGVPRVLF